MNEGRVVSVNVGGIGEITWRDKIYRTGFLKEPVHAPAALGTLGFEDDRQADLSAHGGPDKAVYASPSEHYPFWQDVLGTELPPGSFRENLTVAGLSEETLVIGDRLDIGSVRLVVTQPRLPCVKLSARFLRADMTKRFTAEQRPGFYMSVELSGSIGAGAWVSHLRGDGSVSVTDVFRLLTGQLVDDVLRDRALANPSLGEGARKRLEELTEEPRGGRSPHPGGPGIFEQ